VSAPVRSVTILACHRTMATTVFGPMDSLNQAGRLWPRVHGTTPAPAFEVAIASADGQPVQCTNNVWITPHRSVDQVESADLIVIAATTYIDHVVESAPRLVPWIREQYERGAHVASICTGAFLLAETGLLDGKAATFHWGFEEAFRRRYPNVEPKLDQMVLDQGRLYCSAGVSAGMDLSLYLVEKFCGRETSVQSAKTMLLDLGRERQSPYEAYLAPRAHGDPVVLAAQEWLAAHHTEPVDYDRLAWEYRMSRRSLERRFQRAVGLTPYGYLQRLRVETAKRLLEAGGRTFEDITRQVGYEDITFFRKVFVRVTGMRPKEYQRRFAGYGTRKSLEPAGRGAEGGKQT